MKPLLALALVALSTDAALAQADAQVGTYEVYSGPVIGHTGPRYCPELADTGHPFAPVCPSWRIPTMIIPALDQTVGEETPDGGTRPRPDPSANE